MIICLRAFSVFICDGQSAVAAEGAGGYFDAGRGLAALVLAGIYETHDAFDGFAVKAHCEHFLEAAIFFGVGL